MTTYQENKPLSLDVTLLDGLHAAMSVEEQQEITALMTSGDVEKLAEAATLLYGFAELSKENNLSGKGAIETDSARSLQETPYTNNVAVGKAMLKGDEFTVKRIRLAGARAHENMRHHPLPCRMPRCAAIRCFNPDGCNKGGLLGLVGLPTAGPVGRRTSPTLTFVDDHWDGSLGDAFTRISVGKKGKVKKAIEDNSEIHNILGATEKTQLAEGIMPRVVIGKVRNDAAKLGLHPGDTITHVNGESFQGTSQDLLKILSEAGLQGKGEVFLVVNAEPSVAEALRLRAIC